MATRRRRQARRRRTGFGLRSFQLPDVGKDVARSLVGISLLVLAAVTLTVFLPGEGSVTTWFQRTVGPWFGSRAGSSWLLLLATGWYIEWGPGKAPGSGWGLTLLGVVVAYAGCSGRRRSWPRRRPREGPAAAPWARSWKMACPTS